MEDNWDDAYDEDDGSGSREMSFFEYMEDQYGIDWGFSLSKKDIRREQDNYKGNRR